MENLNRLNSRYKEDQRILDLKSALSQGDVKIEQSIGAQQAFIIRALYDIGIVNHVFVAIDKEEAAYLQNTLDNISEDRTISLLPDSFKRPLHFDELDSHNVLQRTEAINRMSLKLGRGEIVVTYPEALFEKVVDPQVIHKQRIEISLGESLDLDTILELLIEYGFDREEFVFEPGQFSIRGGIVDIFSFGNEWPYRIELFDDEVESIRTFHPGNQLSIRSIKKIAIIPNVTGQYDQSQKISLFDVFPEDTILWIKDTEHLLDRLQLSYDKAEEFAETVAHIEDEKLKEIFKDRAFIYPGDIVAHMDPYKKVFFTSSKFTKSVSKTISFGGKPQPSFNRSFELLIDDMRELYLIDLSWRT